MIIDGHAHAARDYATAESISRMASKYKLDRIVLCTSPKNNLNLKDPPNIPFLNTPNSIYLLNRMLKIAYRSMKDNGDGNKYVFKLQSELPDVVVQFLWVNPLDKLHMSNLEQNIRTCQAKGIKLHQAWNPFAVDSIEFSHLVDVARSKGIPIFIHLYSRRETWKLAEFISRNQDVVFIIAHLLGLDILKERRGHLENVYFDTSGSHRIRGRDILEAIRLFGYDHVVFGSDTPYARIGDQIDKVQRLGLSDNVMEHIFGLNLKNLLSLGP
jgi:predicted TIM-barrel fold metal-dependent hydrolase